MARNRRRRREPSLGENAPPPEQMRDATMDRPTMAYRRVPPIDVMKADGRLNEAQHKALSVYASVYATAARSTVRSCCDTTVRTGGHGPSRAVLSARSDLAWYDRELGALQPIVEAVVGLDTSLSRWVADNGGGKDGSHLYNSHPNRARTPDTGLVRPYRPRPVDFRQTYIQMGWDGIVEHYNTNWRVIRRWIIEEGAADLRAARAAYVAANGRKYLK